MSQSDRGHPTTAVQVTVAIDGPAGAGKSTVTKALTAALGYRLLDTGALYRSVAFEAAQSGVRWDDEAGLAEVAGKLDIRFELDGEQNRVFLRGVDRSLAIRTPEMSQGASVVSAVPSVRAALLSLQRDMGRIGGVVAEGRDIGTVVFPDAEAKFFLTASPEVRAQRRYDELVARGEEVDYDQTLAEIKQRDERDSTREIAPLLPADDAVVVDSSSRTIDDVVGQMLAVVRDREAAAAAAAPPAGDDA